MENSGEKCYFTDLPIRRENVGERTGVFIYSIQVNNEKQFFTFSKHNYAWVDDTKELENRSDIEYGTEGNKLIPNAIKEIKHIIKSLILNGKWNTNNYDYLTKNIVYNQLKYYDYPKTPEDKLNYLFKYICKLQNYDGEEINTSNLYDIEWEKLFFKDFNEFHFYLETLSKADLLELKDEMENGLYLSLCITYKGLLYNIELEQSGKESNNCFVAMSFDNEDLVEIYEKCIYPVLNELGFNPILIKDEHYKSDKTINDAMIAAIKRSKFIIADFTKQKRNVYFESGYAAGREMKVIYTCKCNYFNDKTDVNKKSAFDTNHFPHIIWKDINDYKKQLKDKIEAYIL